MNKRTTHLIAQRHFIIMLTALLLIASCQKNCWHCTAIRAHVHLYTKGNDTIKILFIEGAIPNSGDSLRDLGYLLDYTNNYEEIPIDYSFCNGGETFGAYDKCNRTK